MSESVTVWLASIASMTVILGFVYQFVIRPVNQKLEAVERAERSIAAIEKELHPNGGTSLKDAVTRIELRQMATKSDVSRIEGKLDNHIDFHLNKEGKQ